MIRTSRKFKLLSLIAAMAVPMQAHAQNLGANDNSPADTASGRTLEAPVNLRPLAQKFWWSDEWYDKGTLDVPTNHAISERSVTYVNPADGTEVPAIVYRPADDKRYPAVLFQHGRRGLDELVKRLAKRLAARGFIVLAPDVYAARFIDIFPIAHMPETETDTAAGLDYLLGLDEVSTSKACVVSHTRGGYYTLKAAVTHGKQEKQIACYVSSYPHWQDPNAAEPDQVYRFATEAENLTVPAMIFIGEYEQYQRRRSIETAVGTMKTKGRDVTLIVYPGVGRGFDFRPPTVRTFADDLAAKDANARTAAFMTKHLAAWAR
ncbi:MAG: dienelactone hydrolase family protein [Alphaproteobacteria bacterium]|nr:dienelactone hydrolase family protein [Alphaproteobacteria bacterium]